MKWRENAAALIPETFNSAIMCIGSEINGVGACKGDNGGPGFIFDTGDGLVNEKYVQVIGGSFIRSVASVIKLF